MKRFGLLICALLISAGIRSSGLLWAAERFRPTRLPVNVPIQITTETRPVLYFDVSRDGRWLIYSSGPEEGSPLRIRSLDPSGPALPKQLSRHTAGAYAPALSPDGSRIAYVSNAEDVKGDIFLLSLQGQNPVPVRLTGRETEDGAPSFSPDGKTLYFHQKRSGLGESRLVAVDLPGADRTIGPPKYRMLPTGGDASFPSVSPDGDRVAFVSVRHDPAGDIFILDLRSEKVVPVTRGPAIDFFPAWTGNANQVLFSRIAVDTDRNGKLTTQDNAAVYLVDLRGPHPYPLTALSYSAISPRAVQGRLYFISDRSRATHCWMLPEDGEIPRLPTAREQWDLAEAVSRKMPPEPFLSLLAHYKLLGAYPQEPLAAKSAYRIGRAYADLGMPDAADTVFEMIGKRYGHALPEALLARIDRVVLETRKAVGTASSEADRKAYLDRAESELGQIAAAVDPSVKARADLARTRLLIDYRPDAATYLEALKILEGVIRNDPFLDAASAEALTQRGEIFNRMDRTEDAQNAYLTIVKMYPETAPWSESALSRILDAPLGTASLPEKVERLRRISEENAESTPYLAAGAQLRIGDLYDAAEEPEHAKRAYRNVLDRFPRVSGPTAAARLALAEIFYREERFRQALDLYETELDRLPYADPVYDLARRGYIEKSNAAGEHLYRLGEVHSARSKFKAVIDYEYTDLEAHRGYIRCAAGLDEIPKTLADYRSRLNRHPEDITARYAVALCLTYLEGKIALTEAEKLLQEAIRRNGQIAYFHQTLGYVRETLETVHGVGGNLEKALESYQMAYFLTDPDKNPDGAADLQLNIGNIHYLLGQYAAAFDAYSRRLAAGKPFENKNNQIVFYQRFGASGFQILETEKAIAAFDRAIATIDAQMDPKAASEIFDRIIRYTMDRIVAPGLASPEGAGRAKDVAKRQSEINRRLFEITQAGQAPPSPRWTVYRTEMETLLASQATLNDRIVAFARTLSLTDPSPESVAKTLSGLMTRVREALQFPERMLVLKIELMDRLGLALQENGDWAKAKGIFEQVFTLNRQLGLTENLVRNMRSVAYTTYRHAETLSGDDRRSELESAAAAFRQVLQLIETPGTAAPRDEEKRRALLEITAQVSLEATGATQAARGFTPNQEKRIAETFLARIHIELDQLIPAETALKAQLARYPTDKPVPDKDRVGVSLLHHQAGHLAAASGKWAEAFDHFRNAATLTLGMKNAVSSIVNVLNMAHLLTRIPPLAPGRSDRIARLTALDLELSALLNRHPPATAEPVAARYHNAMGVYLLAVPEDSPGTVEGKVDRMRRHQRAVAHFTTGIRLLEKGQSSESRKTLSLLSALHLNMAHLATALGEAQRADEHFQSAARLALRGMLPHLLWRAQAGLGDYAKALGTLDRVTILNAGSGPGEITRAFAPMVLDLVESQKVEKAFNLAERLSEIERVHRTAPLLEMTGAAEHAVFRDLYPRIERVRRLRKEAEEGKRADVAERLRTEENLLDARMREARKRLPGLIRDISDARSEEFSVLLLGIADDAEKKAESGDAGAYEKRIETYRSLRSEAVGLSVPARVRALFAPEPAEAIDVMETLPEHGILVRIFDAGDRYVVFTVGRTGIAAVVLPSLEGFAVPDGREVYVASETPIDTARPRTLNATHLVRSFSSRKPFKRTLLAIPPDPAPPQSLTAIAPSEITEEEIIRRLPEVHTMQVTEKVGKTTTVPVRAGELPSVFMGIATKTGPRMDLGRLLAQAPNLSLLIVSNLAEDDLYLIGHLASLFGVPTTLVAPDRSTALIQQFLSAYPSTSALAALEQTRETTADPPVATLLGFRGMDLEEAKNFARERFVDYVENGQNAFGANNPSEALTWFESAVQIALEEEAYRQYLGGLYQYCRESAYLSNHPDKALQYARAAADQMARLRPDSKEHADALLRLGLILAHREQFETAVPSLEQAVEMMAALELDEEQIQALSELGVVLENATEYDRALARFESAAALSEKTDQAALLAAQYTSIGRIYDLRLSQYALALQNYQKAMEIYRSHQRNEKIAESLVNIGRCHRLLGNFAAADRHYREARTFSDGTDAEIRAKITIEEANNAWFQGRYQEAFQLQRTARQLASENDLKLMEIVSLNSAGLIWWTLGRPDKALQELDRALAEARALPGRRDEVATALNNRGLVFRDMGQYPEALKIFDEALAIDTAIKSRWAISYDLRNKALTLLKMGRPEGAEPLFERAAAEAGAIGNRINEAKALLGLGEARAALKKSAEAETVFTEALTLSRTMVLQETEWRALFGLAGLKLPARPSDARALLYEAIGIIEKMRADIKIEQLRDSFIVDKLKVYETLISLLADEGRIEESFEVAERSRARNFIDLLGNQRLSLARSVDQDLYRRQQEIRAGISTHETLLAQTQDAADRGAYGQILDRLRNEYENVMFEIQSKNPQLSALVSVQPLLAAGLLPLMEPGVVLLSYYVLDRELLCWRIDGQGMRLFRTPLDRQTLEGTILEFRRMIQNLEPIEDHANRLYDWLIAPVMTGGTPPQTLGIIPHGPLHYLSFATLSDVSGYVVDRSAVFYLPSASVFPFSLNRRVSEKNPKVLAIGNPDLKDPVFDLPFSEYEVGSIRWNFPQITVLTREKATEKWVVDHIQDFGIVHLASHGEFDPINPLFSALKLAKDEAADGNLEAAEVFGLTLRSDLVVLSACQTGLGKVTGGDDVIGLNRAFLYAGTHAIISSLWRVSDLTTAIMVKQFYRKYMTVRKADALRSAMLHVKKRYPHPGYWGAFTLVGDYY